MNAQWMWGDYMPVIRAAEAARWEGDNRLCDACGCLFTKEEWDNRHEGHKENCPNYGQELIEEGCDCDVVYHADCCPECRDEQENER